MITIARRKIGQHCNFDLYHDERLEISFTTRGRRGKSPVLEQLLAVFFQRGGKERACTSRVVAFALMCTCIVRHPS